MRRLQPSRFRVSKARCCKKSSLSLYLPFTLTHSHSFSFLFRSFISLFFSFSFNNGRSCANIACNLCWRLLCFSLPFFFFFLMLQVHARNSEFNLNLIDSGNCNRGSAIRTSNGRDMLHMFERVVSDAPLIERTSFQNEIYFRGKREISRFDCRFGVATETSQDFKTGERLSYDYLY